MQWCSKSNEENKNKEKEPKPRTGGAPWTILQMKFQGPEMYEQKSLGYKH
jgi:hypothetical protein